MREYKVRVKDKHGKPLSGWRTVYANSEEEAVLINSTNWDMEQRMIFPKIRKPKW